MNTRVRVVAAVVVLSQNSVIIGRKITNIFPSAKLYGLVSRTNDVDISFTNFGETVREL
ncbi:precorrin-3B C(17)-methyltransferase, partial [Dolichospermum sp. ST_con]|nr:precorrin-3B C(17)-methyltransferase [Dolichospermum sp. ST_con]